MCRQRSEQMAHTAVKEVDEAFIEEMNDLLVTTFRSMKTPANYFDEP